MQFYGKKTGRQMSYFPFFVQTDNKKILIIGGGRVAAEKFNKLNQFTGSITLLAEDFSFRTDGFKTIKKAWEPADIDGFDVVIAATDDHEVNREIGELCRKKHIFVNTVDDIEFCDFIFPSIVKKDDVTVAISTNGSSPALSQYLRRKTEDMLPDDIGDIASSMKEARNVISKSVHDGKLRKRVYKKMLNVCLSGGDPTVFYPHEIVIATRGSKLAMAQSELVKEKLAELGMTVTLKVVRTQGDRDQGSELAKIGGRGVFVKEIERVLLNGEADIAVHSGKDLPSQIADGLVIAATPEAASDRDVMLSFTDTPKKIGTGSLRRICQLKQVFPDAEFIPIRGNVDTRIRKLRDGEVDAIIVAQAGLDRLGIDVSDFKVRVFGDDECLPAATQGIMAVECRSDGTELRALLSLIDDPMTHERFNAERLFIKALGADCTAPAAARCYLTGTSSLTGHVSPDMSSYVMPVMYEGIRGTFNGVVRFIERDLRPENVNRLLRVSQSGHVPRSHQVNKNVRVSKLLGKIYIVGAGPSYDLLTLRAKYLIEHAEEIVYDDLIDISILSLASPDASFHAVGKRLGSKKATQEQINDLLVTLAEAGKNVVRLKGGDPYVFGRGGEEAEALEKAGIDYEVVPGISTAIAVPEHFGIPVTNRGTARSFSVITGHTAPDLNGESLSDFGKIDGSRIFLMGITQLPHIVDELIKGGASPDTPSAVMSRGYSADEQIIRGRLSDIAEKAKDAPMPGIIFVGENAASGLRYVRKKSVTVTGTKSFTERARETFEEAGIVVKTVPHLLVEPAYDAQMDFEKESILTFTSANGVAGFFSVYDRDLRNLTDTEFACIGPATAAELSKHGFGADYIPGEYTTAELSKVLIKVAKNKKVYLLRADNASDELRKNLDNAGIQTENICIYRTRVDNRLIQGFVPDTDYILFGSANGVKTYFENGGSVGSAQVICIGPVTAKAYGRKCLVPQESDLERVLEVIS